MSKKYNHSLVYDKHYKLSMKLNSPTTVQYMAMNRYLSSNWITLGYFSSVQLLITYNGYTFQVTVPNGMKVSMKSGRISISPSAADVKQVTGLCGNFNGDKDDELIGPDGTKHEDCYYCNEYGASWK